MQKFLIVALLVLGLGGCGLVLDLVMTPRPVAGAMAVIIIDP